MDGYGPPSFTAPRADPSYPPVNDQYYAADDYTDTGPQSFSDMNTGRPVSLTQPQQQPHTRTTDADPNMKRLPTFKDVSPDLGKSYVTPTVDSGNTKRGSFVDHVSQDYEKPHTFGDLANARKHNSGTEGASPYDEVKIPSNSDVRPNIGSNSGNQQGGYPYMSGPKSYNGDNFGKHTW